MYLDVVARSWVESFREELVRRPLVPDASSLSFSLSGVFLLRPLVLVLRTGSLGDFTSLLSFLLDVLSLRLFVLELAVSVLLPYPDEYLDDSVP